MTITHTIRSPAKHPMTRLPTPRRQAPTPRPIYWRRTPANTTGRCKSASPRYGESCRAWRVWRTHHNNNVLRHLPSRARRRADPQQTRLSPSLVERLQREMRLCAGWQLHHARLLPRDMCRKGGGCNAWHTAESPRTKGVHKLVRSRAAEVRRLHSAPRLPRHGMRLRAPAAYADAMTGGACRHTALCGDFALQNTGEAARCNHCMACGGPQKGRAELFDAPATTAIITLCHAGGEESCGWP